MEVSNQLRAPTVIFLMKYFPFGTGRHCLQSTSGAGHCTATTQKANQTRDLFEVKF
jgi:hypothetical protein